jgi:hypothetical protein
MLLVIEDEEQAPNIQKIIPDGFTELIFHFGDPYGFQQPHLLVKTLNMIFLKK